MKIELQHVTVGEITDGYRVDDEEQSVVGYGGRLDIRPKYQREFIYKDAQRDAVVNTALNGYPLNVMYWVKKEDGGYEVLDGQQRTLSLCQYVAGDFFVQWRGDLLGFANLPKEDRERLRKYKLTVYVCEGEQSEKLAWFRTINIAGEHLYEQELRNAVYAGPWTLDAKRHFSKTNCAAYGMARNYMAGSCIRQDYLETAIKWISDGKIDEYMASHQHAPDASELWTYFQGVINWTKAKFPRYRDDMKGVAWGELYNKFGQTPCYANVLEAECARLMEDEEVTNKKGIYTFLFTRDEKHLSLRKFPDKMKRETYERQRGRCARCGRACELNEMEADHVTPWSQGGTTTKENCQMLCRDCNRRKSDK